MADSNSHETAYTEDRPQPAAEHEKRETNWWLVLGIALPTLLVFIAIFLTMGNR